MVVVVISRHMLVNYSNRDRKCFVLCIRLELRNVSSMMAYRSVHIIIGVSNDSL